MRGADFRAPQCCIDRRHGLRVFRDILYTSGHLVTSGSGPRRSPSAMGCVMNQTLCGRDLMTLRTPVRFRSSWDCGASLAHCAIAVGSVRQGRNRLAVPEGAPVGVQLDGMLSGTPPGTASLEVVTAPTPWRDCDTGFDHGTFAPEPDTHGEVLDPLPTDTPIGVTLESSASQHRCTSIALRCGSFRPAP